MDNSKDKSKDKLKGKNKSRRKARARVSLNGRSVTRKPDGIKVAPKDGPSLSLRMRNREQLRGVQRAAAKAKLSMNTWAVEVLERAVEAAG